MGRAKVKNRSISFFLITISLLFIAQLTASSDLPLWGDLQPGPYGVGFKAVEKYDNTRTFGAKYDYFGNLIEGVRTRQLQICIWYPAVVDPETGGMIFGEYSYVYPENEDFIGVLARLNSREIQQLFGITGGNRGYVTDFMNTPMAAVKDAPAAAGSFPKLIYIPHFESSYCANAVLCEYLASHGFIVATTHPVGTNDLNPGFNSSDIETVARDAEFVIGYLNDFPPAAADKTALISFGSGGISAQLLQMRNSDIDAIVSLGGTYTFENFQNLFREGDYFNPEKMRVPLMHM